MTNIKLYYKILQIINEIIKKIQLNKYQQVYRDIVRLESTLTQSTINVEIRKTQQYFNIKMVDLTCYLILFG